MWKKQIKNAQMSTRGRNVWNNELSRRVSFILFHFVSVCDSVGTINTKEMNDIYEDVQWHSEGVSHLR